MNVKVSHVNNLTDARYFAAAGVYYIGFCCNPGTTQYCSTQRITEICQWIEGPKFILEFDGWQSEADIEQILATITADGLHFGAFSTYQNAFNIPVFKDFILENINEAHFAGVDHPVIRSDKRLSSISEDELLVIHTLMADKKYYIDIPFEPADLERLIHLLPEAGLIVRGGTEEKTGFKSFEQLDDIFDTLEKLQ